MDGLARKSEVIGMIPINNSDTAWLIVTDYNQDNNLPYEELREDIYNPAINQWHYENNIVCVGVGGYGVGGVGGVGVGGVGGVVGFGGVGSGYDDGVGVGGNI